MERRVFIAILLSFLVLFGYQRFFSKPEPVAPAATATAPAAAPSADLASGTVVAGAALAPSEGGDALVGEQVEREVVVDTPVVTATFTNRGGRLTRWRLKEYRDRAGAPLEMVAAEFAESHPLPLTLQAADAALTGTLNRALYTVRREPAEGLPAQGPVRITFEYRGGDGVSVVKTVEVDPATFVLRVQASVTRGAETVPVSLVWAPGPGDNDSQTSRGAVKPEALFATAGASPKRVAGSKATAPLPEQPYDFVGIDDHYFTALALKVPATRVIYAPLSVPPPAGSTDAAREFMGFSIGLAQGQPLTFYVGPKDFTRLTAIDRNLKNVIDFGWFRILVEPLLQSLKWINRYVGNYGWTILILTVLINLILFPLNHKSVVSMRKMSEIQPQAKAIQERYSGLSATDPAKQKMNQELMALYREHGVNPASGCIPILLTLPVFLAFYALLSTAIELRGAPFIFWIHDLSLPDPYYVMPVLVGASQVITQLMTPQPGADPVQQRMMLVMPVVLIFVFISTPAGALIYWLVGNIWRMGQMQVTNYIHPPQVKAYRPAAERRIKQAGRGKSSGAAQDK